VNDLKRFYMRWYGAANAVLTVAGDVKTEEVLKMAEKYFGRIGKGPEVKLQAAVPATLAATRYISYEDQVKFPLLNTAWPTAQANTKEDAALDVLAQVLAGTQSSPLYKAFIESKKATSAQAFQYSRELAGQFHISIRANAGTRLSETEKELQHVLAEWEKTGVTDDDMKKFKARYKSDTYSGLTTVQGKGAQLAHYFTLTGNANNLKVDMQRYLGLTKEDVMNVYKKYIKGKPAVVLSCLPKEQGDLRAQPDNWKMYERTIETESPEYRNLTYTEPKDDFDRSKIPAAKPASPVPVPDFYTMKLANDIPLIGVTETEIPKVNILISFRAGHRFEPKAKAGMSMLLARMLEKSTKKTKTEEIEARLDRLGSSMDIYSGDEDLNVNISSLSENLSETMKIVEECLLEPKFDSTEFALEKKKQLDGIMQAQTSAAAMADMAFRKVLYGNDHVMRYTNNGDAETVNGITLDDVKGYYGKFSSGIISVAVTGDVKKEAIGSHLGFLSKYRVGTPLGADNSATPKIDKTRIYFVDKKGAAQSEIRIGYIALPYDAYGDYYKSNIMNFSFAGAFNSRTNYLLREIKGWTYGTRGYFSGTQFPGPYTISGGFKSNTTDSTLTEIFGELKKYVSGGIKDDELEFARNAMLQSDALKYESPFQKLGFIKRVLDYNLSRDYVARQSEILKTINKDEINSLAKKYLPYEQMAVVVVGDKATNLEKVKKLGYEVVEMDVNGKVVN
jgi:zinc protease